MLWNKYKNLMVFAGVSIVGVILYLLGDNELAWKIYNMIGATTTVALAVLAFMTYLEYAKGEDKIKIYFVPDKNDNTPISCKKIYTTVYTQRKYFTRGEVLGLLRMIQVKQEQFKLKSFNDNVDILKQFDAIQKAKINELSIPITSVELKQFKVVCNKHINNIHSRIINKK